MTNLTVHTTHDFIGLLNHWNLVFTHRDNRCFKCSNVSRLCHRVTQKTC
ncbi:Uncharacterised protein [Mycobacteroides abscessus subsp. abscessus]|nr:Uncharacterised protein [Mycobacteroides abscessus subsp. abscessus]